MSIKGIEHVVFFFLAKHLTLIKSLFSKKHYSNSAITFKQEYICSFYYSYKNANTKCVVVQYYKEERSFKRGAGEAVVNICC